MKKNGLNDSLDPGVFQKMSKIMRILFVLIFGISMAAQAKSYAQNTRIDVDLNNSSVREVINYVENNSKFIFLYKNSDLDMEKRVSLKLTNASIDEILSVIFSDDNISYDIYDRQIVVRGVEKQVQQTLQGDRKITGIVSDDQGEPLPGVSVIVTGTTKGTVTDLDGKFNLNVPGTAASITVSFIGMKAQEVLIGQKSQFVIVLEQDVEGIDEVVVVGYGTQQKANITASVSQIKGDILENRAVTNVSRGLQGAVSNLNITSTSYGGEPGASMDLNIRGLVTVNSDGDVENGSPLVLVDGVEMAINDVNPEDVETISVLKDASAAAIYGSRAAAGVILITTKNGKNMNGGMKIDYSSNFSWASPTKWPDQASAIDFAYTMNDAATNVGSSVYYTDEELGYIIMNMESPGSAPTLQVASDGVSWDQSNVGLGATAATDWKDFLFKDWAPRSKHNISFRGGTDKLNYYASAGYYSEDGINAHADEFYKRYNFDVKISAKPYDWLSFDLLTKLSKSEEKHPWDYSYGGGRIFDLLSKIKPTLPTVDPLFNEPLVQAYYPLWDTQWQDYEKNQVTLLPRVVIEPVKNWLINLEYNYKRDNNINSYTALQYEYHQADGSSAYTPTESLTQVKPTLYHNEYYSPNIYTSYSKDFNGHNFKVLAGYQSETQDYYSLSVSANTLITDNIPSVSTSVGEITASDGISTYSTQSYFSRFNYDYKGKYLFEMSYRYDGSSKFEESQRWAGFPSYSVGYNVAKEDFWPFKDDIQTFKLRGSYGQLGNMNVSNFTYLSTMSVNEGTYLFGGEWDYYVTTPSLISENLTWERVKTTDVGLDLLALKGKLGFSFDWYRTDISDMMADGATLPSVLGTDEPKTNSGTMRTQGWETELTWKHKLGDFSYNVRFVLSDYKRTVVEWENSTGLLSDWYEGQNVGDIMGLEWAGWFESADDVSNYGINQTAIYSSWEAGDTKYVDQNDDDIIDIGDNTVSSPGDRVVIGNTTPRYQYGLTLGCEWKGIDFSVFIQGVGKRDYYMGGSAYRGPANGPYHANVYEYHLDYWRDETSILGANPDAHWAKPYSANPGKNNRNYKYSVDRYVEDASYMRLKTIQVGYTLPGRITKKVKMDRVRIYVSGENLLTFTKFPMYDPESITGNYSNAIAYPLSKVISAGINVSL